MKTEVKIVDMNKLKLDEKHNAKSADELVLEFEHNKIKHKSSKLIFNGVADEKDVYNITAPFWDNGSYYIAGRVESRDSEYSEVIFFKKSDCVWTAQKDIKPLPLQDPFVTRVGKELILGGVEVFDDSLKTGTLNYRTVFYKGESLYTLKRFTAGPDRMKDIRILELPNNKILVMTRPQGEAGGRGKIGYTLLDSIDELNEETILGAKLLNNQFISEEWGGCNELHLLTNGKIGVLSHIAKFDVEGNRHYYSTAFCFDWESGAYSPMKIIAVRDNFEDGPAKRCDLRDVIFSGGLLIEDGQAQLYCGVSDAEGHMITIRNPFMFFVK